MLDGFSVYVTGKNTWRWPATAYTACDTNVYEKMITFPFWKALWIPANAGMTSGAGVLCVLMTDEVRAAGTSGEKSGR